MINARVLPKTAALCLFNLRAPLTGRDLDGSSPLIWSTPESRKIRTASQARRLLIRGMNLSQIIGRLTAKVALEPSIL